MDGQDRAEVLRGEHLVGRVACPRRRSGGRSSRPSRRPGRRRDGEVLVGPLGPRDRGLVLGERAVVDDRAHEVARSRSTSPIASASTSATNGSLDLRPHRLRHVGARGGRALLALELEGAADHRDPQHVGVGRGVGDDEVLAAGLADDPRVGAVRRDVLADGAPQVLEGRRGAGEVDAGEVGVGQRDLRHVEAVAGEHVDDARRHPRLLEQLHRQRRGELLGRRRLPDHRVAHQRRRGRQVAGDRGEVERRDRVDEALERAVVGAVPDAGAVRDRLVGEDLLRVVDVEAPEVDQLAGGVDLGLERRLGLAQHGRGVDPLPPRAGQQVGGLEDDRARARRSPWPASRARPSRPCTAALASAWRGVLQYAEHVLVVVGLDDLDLRAAAGPPLRRCAP